MSTENLTPPGGWHFPLTQTTQDKSAARPGCKFPSSFELLGVDGSVDGGLRPFPGFIPVHEFDLSSNGGLSGWEGTSAQHDERSVIVDFFVRDFIVGEDSYGYGFVYRVQRGGNQTHADVFIDYFNGKTGLWVRSLALLTDVPTNPSQDPIDGRRMSVVTWGRLIYVFIEDHAPVSFSIERDSPYTASVINTTTGPQKRPFLCEPSKGSTVYSGGLGSITTTGDASRPGAGQIFLTNGLPSTVGLGLTGGSHQADIDVRSLTPGDYAFAYQLYNSQTGLRSAISDIVPARTDDFDPGSGPVNLNAAIEIVYDSSLYDWAFIYRSVRVQDAGGTYIASILQLDAIITLEDHLTNNNPLTGNLLQAVWFYTLEDKELVQTEPFSDNTLYDENMPKGGAALYYENTMLVSSINTTSVSTSDENRRDDAIRGLGELRYSALTEVSPELFPPANRYNPTIPSNDIILLRQVGPNVIGFSKDRQYHIRKEGFYLKPLEMHEGFGVVNDRAADTVGSLCYFVNSKGLKSVDSQGQLEDIRSLNKVIQEDWQSSISSVCIAYDPWSSTLWILNADLGEAVILWFNTAKVTQLRDLPFNLVARGVWPEQFDWDRTDLVNNAGVNNSSYYNPLAERVFFIAKAPLDPDDLAPTGSPTGYIFRVYCMDYYRERTQTEGSFIDYPRRTLMPISADALFTVAHNGLGGTDSNLVRLGTDPNVLSYDIWGSYLYVVWSTEPTRIGLRAEIFSVGPANAGSTNTIQLSDPPPAWSTIKAGDIVAVSPVYFRWIGPPLQTFEEMQLPPSSPFRDYFHVRHVDSIGASFTDVVNERAYTCPLTGAVFLGSDASPAAVGFTYDVQGAEYSGLEDGEGLYYMSPKLSTSSFTARFGADGTVLAPSICTYTPDTDFRLVGIMVTGSVRESTRTRRPVI